MQARFCLRVHSGLLSLFNLLHELMHSGMSLVGLQQVMSCHRAWLLPLTSVLKTRTEVRDTHFLERYEHYKSM